MSSTKNSLWGFPIVEVDAAELIARRVVESSVARLQKENNQRIVASMVCTYEAQEDLDLFSEMRRQLGCALAPFVAEFIADGRNYNYIWSWEISDDETCELHTLQCDGVAWLSSWSDCKVGELTNDPELTQRNPLTTLIFFREEDSSESKEFQKVECTGAGIGFIRLQ